MSVTGLGNNISSLVAQRGLVRASEALSRSSARLSSGLRINTASDDAAGLAVADQLSNQKRIYTASQRNISDGVSALTIAGAALENQTAIIVRMMELAEQAANGTFSATQRESLASEYDALTREFGRIGATTEFNGVSLLHSRTRGGVDEINLQAGVDGTAGSTIAVGLGDSGVFSGQVNRDDLVYNTSDITGLSGLTVENLKSIFGTGFYQLDEDTIGGLIDDAGLLNHYVYSLDDDGLFSEIAVIKLDIDAVTGLVINAADVLELGFDFRALSVTSPEGASATPNLGEGTNLELTRIDTQEYALMALDTVRARGEELSVLRGAIGSSESRLQTAFSVSGSLQQEVAASESRIRDVDVAEEVSALTAAQVRQQIATQILRAANLQPELTLSLLQ